MAPKPGTGVAGHQLASPSDRRLAVRAACTMVLVVHRFAPSPVHPRTFARRYSEPVWSCDPTRTCPQLLIPGSARTRHRFGDEAGSRERTTGKIDTWAVTGPSNVKKHRKAWRNSEHIPPGQPCSVSPMPQMAKYGADELA